MYRYNVVTGVYKKSDSIQSFKYLKKAQSLWCNSTECVRPWYCLKREMLFSFVILKTLADVREHIVTVGLCVSVWCFSPGAMNNSTAIPSLLIVSQPCEPSTVHIGTRLYPRFVFILKKFVDHSPSPDKEDLAAIDVFYNKILNVLQFILSAKNLIYL